MKTANGERGTVSVPLARLDAARWTALWTRTAPSGNARDVFESLAAAYVESARAYHGVAHIVDCLAELDGARSLAARPDHVEVALWFHDAVYDSRAKDNEERSAGWARRALVAGGAAPDVMAHVAALILATKHDRPLPDDPDARLISDIDLSILGRDPDAFAAYDRAIRVEYAWVSVVEYRAGRRAVLEGFLRREAIYHTPVFRDRYEAAARRNLERAIARYTDRDVRGGAA